VRILVWSASFKRAFKQLARQHPQLSTKAQRILQQLSEDPAHATLRTHKLKGKLAGSWACSVDYDTRIVFDFVTNPESGEEEILLLTVGSHDEVY
jgi:addiction module RelE/StbE family toxin